MQPANEAGLRKSATVMRVVGWLIIICLPAAILVYPAGFLWGDANLPVVSIPHPPSPYDGLHPYLFMLASVYLAWAILLIRGARNPRANAALFDWGILANLLHGLVMVPQALLYPNEVAHMWADIPMLFVLCLVLWAYHPNRLKTKTA
ncbi:MAG: DUF6632 domain-containing protein [Hyphomicrobiaceae bacterium]